MSKAFKTSVFGGFNKKDVIEYLDNVSREHNVEKNRAENEILQLEKHVSSVKAQVKAAEGSIDALREDIGQREETIGDLKSQLEAYKKDNDALKSNQNELVRQISQLENSISKEAEKLVFALEENIKLKENAQNAFDKSSALDEMKRREKELENRIFDLEAEILQSYEKNIKVKEYSGTEKAKKSAVDVSKSIQQEDVKGDKKALLEVKRQLEDIIEEINRLVSNADTATYIPKKEVKTPAPPANSEKDSGRLISVKDILRFVGKKR